MTFNEPTHFSFTTGYEWRREGVELSTNWHAAVLDRIQVLTQERGNRAKRPSPARTFWRLLRQGAFKRGIKVGPITVDGSDQERLHGIVTEIDTRRVFYEHFAFEQSRYCIESVRAARDKIRDLSRGTWADSRLEVLLQDLHQALADFLTRAEPHVPGPPAEWPLQPGPFVRSLTEMRLQIWTIIALLNIHVGDVVRPKHLPPWLLQEIRHVHAKAI
jgi:hypothetical protein